MLQWSSLLPGLVHTWFLQLRCRVSGILEPMSVGGLFLCLLSAGCPTVVAGMGSSHWGRRDRLS